MLDVGFKSRQICNNIILSKEEVNVIIIFPLNHTGKSFSEALILASTNPQYDKRLFMELS